MRAESQPPTLNPPLPNRDHHHSYCDFLPGRSKVARIELVLLSCCHSEAQEAAMRVQVRLG